MRAGITFPIGRIGRYMRTKRFTKRVGIGAPIVLASVMEYLCLEVVEIAGDVCKEFGKKRITPRHIELAVRGDDELARLFLNTSFANAGVAPYINPVILGGKK